MSAVPSIEQQIISVLGAEHSQYERERILNVARPLYDEDTQFTLANAADVPNDIVDTALRIAFGSSPASKWSTMIAGDGFSLSRCDFESERAYETKRISVRDAHRTSLMRTCEGNTISMLHRILPNSILLPTGRALPPELEWQRYHAVERCLSGEMRPNPNDVRFVIVATYLDFCMHGNSSISRARLEPLAKVAAKAVIPYGLRTAGLDPEPTFLSFGA